MSISMVSDYSILECLAGTAHFHQEDYLSLYLKTILMRLTTLIYQTALSIYKIFPFKIVLCHIIKFFRIPHSLFYKDLKFKGPFRVACDHKSFLIFHYGGTIENETFWNGLFVSWESETGWLWKTLCPRCHYIFDIGANTGIYSLVAKTINPAAHVYAFVPARHTFPKLARNILLNGFDIICEKLAVSSQIGLQTFYDVPDENQTSASLSPDKLKNFKDYQGPICEYAVETVTLAHYVETHAIPQIDLIKIDVELHEPQVVAGLGPYLERWRPIIFLEVLTPSIAEELNKIIDREKFTVFKLISYRKAIRVPRFEADPDHWNFVVFSKDKEQWMNSFLL
ncbi:MAG: FkbM family methyltransferase [Flavobacteriales bacterium]|nr:FkbM family methyltransferase [Flavobacteriales bacterium]MDW8409432.1 FkbM family methyltransferase [Flavobacteriales bacterium]